MVAGAESVLGLHPNERAAVKDFLARVHTAFGDQAREAMLFGSKARRESTDYSDIDVLLIIADESWRVKDDICNISADISLEYDVLLDVRVIGAARWQYMSEIRAGLYRQIERDAIHLAI